MVRNYIQILLFQKEKHQEAQSTKLLTAHELVIQVVPCVLQGFLELPPHPLLNRASQNLSIISFSVTKATLDHVNKTLTAVESQAIFSCSIRDDMVHSILTKIRDKYPQEILLTNSANFAPVLLISIADVEKNDISKIFKPPSETPPISDVLSNEECPSERPCQKV